MSDTWALALGILFFAVWAAFMIYHDSVSKAYTQGRIDQIRHKNLITEYRGIPAFFYRQGRKSQAKQYRLKVRNRISRNGNGTAIPR